MRNDSHNLIVLRKPSPASKSGLLSVPVELMEHLKQGMLFRAEFTDEGILYRHVGDIPKETEVPGWAREHK
jgi:hypothetical protein